MHAPFIDKVDVSITETQYHLPSSSYFFFHSQVIVTNILLCYANCSKKWSVHYIGKRC
jgi:hypothetical protein